MSNESKLPDVVREVFEEGDFQTRLLQESGIEVDFRTFLVLLRGAVIVVGDNHERPVLKLWGMVYPALGYVSFGSEEY
jgi:hypothetical protein